MKKLFTASLLLTAMTLGTAVSTTASAIEIEGVSGNAGVVSQYFFRGIAQTATASASGGFDYENGNFSVGTWAADVQDGLEIDFYGAYGFETDGGLGLSAGFTSYQYTGDFDSAYNEVNLGLSYSFLSVSYNVGVHEEDDDLGIEESDYDFLAVTAEYESFYATVGTWGQDFEGDYVELGYGAEVAGFDVGVAVIINSEELDVETGEGEESLVFSIGKSF
ncbi:TorF family putative porin [Thalassotalea fonticola]|uniref:TorF family putative porin n=1 Tax=Thalassotalea fonticola TaxID=3065649 RepID=A0ABZ0GLL9_9GAMM|nr:TorF family putative porin [Colwelliaceae bacterium S1-1]